MPPLPEDPGDDNENLPTLKIDWDTATAEEEDEAVTRKEEQERRRKVRQEIHTRYPFLNSKQVELVGTLDDAIDNAIPRVHLPRLKIENMEHALSRRDVWLLLKTPFWIFVGTLTAGLAVALTMNHTFVVARMYPYWVTLVTFLASVPSIRSRYQNYFQLASTKIEDAKAKVEPAIDKLESKATNLVVVARTKLNSFLKSIRTELNHVTKAKTFLKQSNCYGSEHMEKIPDPSDLEGYLNERENQIRGSIGVVRSSLDLNNFVPWVLKKEKNFHIGVIFPVLVVMLVIQFLSTWRAVFFWEEQVFDEENKWEPVIASIQTFAMSLLQIGFAFYVTRWKRMVHFANRRIKGMNDDVNTVLRSKATGAFHSVLDVAMSYVKDRVLQLVHRVRQVERLAVSVQGAAHELQSTTSYLQGTVQSVEQALSSFAQVEQNNQASSWLQSASDFLSRVIYHVDYCTAGLVDCTGFVNSDTTTDEVEEEIFQTKQQRPEDASLPV